MVTFLVVDEPRVATLVRRAFESDGHACREAGSIVEAKRVVAKERIEGIVLDVQLTGGNGLSWLERVSRSRPELTRRTVVVTGADFPSADRRRIAKVGAVLLVKPFSLETLHSVFLDLVRREGQIARLEADA